MYLNIWERQCHVTVSEKKNRNKRRIALSDEQCQLCSIFLSDFWLIKASVRSKCLSVLKTFTCFYNPFVCLLSGDLFIFSVWVSFFIFYFFVLSVLQYFSFHVNHIFANMIWCPLPWSSMTFLVICLTGV